MCASMSLKYTTGHKRSVTQVAPEWFLTWSSEGDIKTSVLRG